MPLETARWRLATLWFSGAGLIFLILVGQSMGNVFESTVNDAWAWALPNIVPTLGLMISILTVYATITDAETDRFTVRKPFYRLTAALSVFYLINLTIVIAGAPLVIHWGGGGGVKTPIDVLHTSNFWLGPLAGPRSGCHFCPILRQGGHLT